MCNQNLPGTCFSKTDRKSATPWKIKCKDCKRDLAAEEPTVMPCGVCKVEKPWEGFGERQWAKWGWPRRMSTMICLGCQGLPDKVPKKYKEPPKEEPFQDCREMEVADDEMEAADDENSPPSPPLTMDIY